MKIKIPTRDSIKFNESMYSEGTAVAIKRPHQEFGILGIVNTYEPNVLAIALNKPRGYGHLEYIEVSELASDSVEIIPLSIDEGGKAVLPVKVFDAQAIPEGSLLEDEHGEVCFIVEVESHALHLQDANGKMTTFTSEEYFALSAEDQKSYLVYVSDAISSQWIKDADNYKEANKPVEGE